MWNSVLLCSLLRKRRGSQNSMLQRGNIHNKIWEHFDDKTSTNSSSTPNFINRISNNIVSQSFVFGVAKELKCGVCDDVISGDDSIMCDVYHVLHFDCFVPYLSTEIESKNVPLECYECYCPLIESTWRKKVDKRLFKRYEKEVKIVKGYTHQSCPNAACLFDLFFDPSNETMPEKCECEICEKTWCTECSRHINDDKCPICSSHFKDLLISIVDATDELGGTKCPRCGVRGQKPAEDCTHIECPCEEAYCYCCGVSARDVDTDNPDSDSISMLFGHNERWEEEDSRCPLYLHSFSRFYEGFPDDYDEAAQERFHQIRAAKKLKSLKEENEDDVWEYVLSLDPVLEVAVNSVLHINCTRL
eukprot:TRINITY_DN5777_c0_g2_i2.p1 TRINITY_DN5777_c0_g2~~TRINITY_DN5777_c0_g2_i2.p1  ORF type:complete len:360 (+),score=55.82 TRINITY_DN5777_c0_g2_i2:207-1286(+)